MTVSHWLAESRTPRIVPARHITAITSSAIG